CSGRKSAERVAGDVNPKNPFLLHKPLGLRPWRHVGESVGRLRLLEFFRRSAEERDLTGGDVLLPQGRLANCGVEGGRKLRAVSAERIHRTRMNQRLEHSLVADAEIDPLTQVEE